MLHGHRLAFFNQSVQSRAHCAPAADRHRGLGGRGRGAANGGDQLVSHGIQGISAQSGDLVFGGAHLDGVLHIGAHRQAGQADALAALRAGGHRGPTGFGDQVQALHRQADGGGQGVWPVGGVAVGQGQNVPAQGGGHAGTVGIQRIAQLAGQRAEGDTARLHQHTVGDSADVEGVAGATFSDQIADINGAARRGLAGDQRSVGSQIGRAII